jgi:N,N'-diacetyllegionaminate synthase
MKKLPHIIAEFANFHGGDIRQIQALVEQVAAIEYADKAVKFQPISAETLALPTFEYFKVYQKLEISTEDWAACIDHAAEQIGPVWIDIFDAFGCDVVKKNKNNVKGIKLQASVLDNLEIYDGLCGGVLKELEIIVNISGYPLQKIEQMVAQYVELRPKKLILQLGYQSYPTAVSDTGLGKIEVLKQAFPGRDLCLADHVDGEDPLALYIPMLGACLGCEYIEKHICLDREKAAYDKFSALEPEQFAQLTADITKLAGAFEGEFILPKEAEYLEKSYQFPITNRTMQAGELLAKPDLIFRRSDVKGLTLHQLKALQEEGKVLRHDIEDKSVLRESDFKDASIGCIVACRMKSSRLKRKAKLPIHGVPSVERCLQNVQMIDGLNVVVLATSTVEEDAVLQENAQAANVEFVRGDPDDVILRYLSACDKYGIDVVIRITGDCPVVSPEIVEFMLNSHFTSGADFTAPIQFAVGTNSEIYNVSALRRVIELLGQAKYSEYMGFYMRNNPELFKINMVDLPGSLIRDYRLTLDYPEDLEMFNRLYEELDKSSLPATTKNVFDILDNAPAIAAINKGMVIKYETDQDLIDMLNRETRIRI